MLNKSKPSLRKLAAVFAGLFVLTFFFFGGNALADRDHGGHGKQYKYDRYYKHDRYYKYDKHYGHGKAVYTLPRGYRTVVVKGHKHYYHRGVYYRRGPSGYVVVQAPVGVVVPALPLGFQVVLNGGSTYFTFGGVYYRRVPAGYVVVEAPPAPVIYRRGPVVAPAPVGGSVCVTAAMLNVRSGPGGGYNVIHQVHRGNVLEIQGNSYGWLYVKLPWGNYGWVSAEFTTPAG